MLVSECPKKDPLGLKRGLTFESMCVCVCVGGDSYLNRLLFRRVTADGIKDF